MWCATSRRQHLLPAAALSVDSVMVDPVTSVRDLGIYIDTDIRTHVQRTVSCCFAVLRQLRQIRRLIPPATFQTLMVAYNALSMRCNWKDCKERVWALCVSTVYHDYAMSNTIQTKFLQFKDTHKTARPTKTKLKTKKHYGQLIWNVIDINVAHKFHIYPFYNV